MFKEIIINTISIGCDHFGLFYVCFIWFYIVVIFEIVFINTSIVIIIIVVCVNYQLYCLLLKADNAFGEDDSISTMRSI